MKPDAKLLFFLTVTYVLLCCKREPAEVPVDVPQDVVLPAISVDQINAKANSAIVRVIVTRRGNVNIKSYGCIWDCSPSVFITPIIHKIEMQGSPSSDTFDIALSGLEDNTLFYGRPYLITAKDTIYANSIEFQTITTWQLLSGGYPGKVLSGPATFDLNGKTFIGGGFPSQTGFYHFDRTNETWIVKDSLISSRGLEGISAFAINGIGYFAMGGYFNSGYKFSQSLWSYTEQGGWVQVADCPGVARHGGVGFSLVGKGYVGLGNNATDFLSDFWSYDPNSNTWTQMPDFPGGKRTEALAFVIGAKAYVGFGFQLNGVKPNDLWEFDPTQPDPWNLVVTNTSPPTRRSGFVFAIGDTAYVGGGSGDAPDIWSFHPNDIVTPWKKFGDLPMGSLGFATGVSLGDHGMVVGGRPQTNNGNLTSQCWIFYPD